MNEILRARLMRLKQEADFLIELIDNGALQPMESRASESTESYFRLPSFKVIDMNPINEPDPTFKSSDKPILGPITGTPPPDTIDEWYRWCSENYPSVRGEDGVLRPHPDDPRDSQA